MLPVTIIIYIYICFNTYWILFLICVLVGAVE